MIYILKHPIKSIFWVIKAYFVLLFWLLLLAFLLSRCAEASSCRQGSLMNDVCVVPAPTAVIYTAYSESFRGEAGQGPTIAKAIADYVKKLNASSKPDKSESPDSFSCFIILENTRSFAVGSLIQPYTAKTTTTQTMRWEYRGNGSGSCPEARSSSSTSEFNLIISEGTEKPFCPPDSYPSFLNYRKINGKDYCTKPTDGQCFKDMPTSMPSFYFPTDGTQEQTICVPADDPTLKCPYKFNNSFPNGQRVYVPDINNNRACEDGLKPEKPKPEPPKKDCKVLPDTGLKICPADPNEKCKPDATGQIRCENQCGYFGGEFVCFDEPKHIRDPKRPDGKPLDGPDDDVSDPNKKMQDITKQDLKDSHKGVESRLDDILTQLQNNGEGQQFDLAGTNSLLRSIDGSLTDLKNGLSDNGQGTAPTAPDNDRKKNNWETKNFQTVLEKHMNTLKNNPTFSAVRTFFNVRNFGGTCPTYSINAWVFELSIDQLCSSQFLSVMPVIKAIVILMFTWFGFRIAFL